LLLPKQGVRLVVMPIVVTIDQKRSRQAAPQAATLAHELNRALGSQLEQRFEITVGDELQGVLDVADSLTIVTRRALAMGQWWIGVGIGRADVIGPSARQSSGPAFFAARRAIGRAKKVPWGVAVEPAGTEWTDLLESAIAVWATLLLSRTQRGWEAVNLRDTGLSELEIAERLGITQQAVHQRLRSAFYQQDLEGASLVVALAERSLRDHNVE
jgi:DNA-binding CsgD family transcriptional regulator